MAPRSLRAALRAVSAGFALALAYTLVAAIATYPLVRFFPRAVPVETNDPSRVGDGAMFVWNVHHFTTAIRHDEDPFFARDIFVPRGTTLWLHTYAPVLGALGLLGGRPLTVVAASLYGSFVLSGLGGYAFARKFLDSKPLAAIAGGIFAFCPFKLAHLLGHYNLELTATLPWFARSVLAWHDEHALSTAVCPSPTPRQVSGSAALLLVTVASDYQYALFCLWIVLVTLGIRWFERTRLAIGMRDVLCGLTLAIAVATLFVHTARALGIRANGAFHYSTDVLGFVVPSADHWLFGGPRLRRLRELLGIESVEHETFAGLTVLALTWACLRRRALRMDVPRERWLVGLLAASVMLGSPVARIGGIPTLGMPHAVLHVLPLVSNFRVPARFAILTMLALPVVAMVGIERLAFPSLKRRRARLLVSGVVALAVLFEFARKPYATLSESDVPAVYHELASRPEGTLLELPFGIRDGFVELGRERTSAMFFATVHEKPLLGGMVARLPASTSRAYADDPVLSALLEAEGQRPGGRLERLSLEDMDRFVLRVDLRYVLVRPEANGSEAEREVARLLEGRLASTSRFGDWTLLVVAR